MQAANSVLTHRLLFKSVAQIKPTIDITPPMMSFGPFHQHLSEIIPTAPAVAIQIVKWPYSLHQLLTIIAALREAEEEIECLAQEEMLDL
jgi:hypothetical protein